jgi:hypothetical protein
MTWSGLEWRGEDGVTERSFTNSYNHSREDTDAAESQISIFRKASMAAVWEGMVCGMYDVDHWQLLESRDS